MRITAKTLPGALSDLCVPKTFLEVMQDRRTRNKTPARYFRRMSKKYNEPKFAVYADQLEKCSLFIETDVYIKSKVRDIKRVNRCKNPFCANCRKVKQAAQIAKYTPLLKKYSEYLYHLVVTNPNVQDKDLGMTIEKMIAKFLMLTHYLRGYKKIKGVDFEKLGYIGVIRSLEVPYRDNPKDPKCYHPHFHCAIAFDRALNLEKTNVNAFSHDHLHKKELRKFSDLEILIQKIWYLLMNDQKVTKKAIDALDLGYSCMINEFDEGKYAELFKYVTKTTSQTEHEMKQEHLETLYFALYRKKSIQGYGVFNNVNGDVEDELMLEVQSLYDKVIEYLQKQETPELSITRLDELIKDVSFRLISKKTIKKQLISVFLRE